MHPMVKRAHRRQSLHLFQQLLAREEEDLFTRDSGDFRRVVVLCRHGARVAASEVGEASTSFVRLCHPPRDHTLEILRVERYTILLSLCLTILK
eukprot:SAG11_NODE_14583_length_607_cov_0.421260_1_plen_93_part_10